MSTQPMQNRDRARNFPTNTGLVASKVVGKPWQLADYGLPISEEVGKKMFGGQMEQSEVKRPFAVMNPNAVKIADGSFWVRDSFSAGNTLLNGQPSADKSKRHPLAQAWRDAGKVAPVDDEIVISDYTLQPILLLTAGELPIALLTAGNEIPVQPTPDMEALEEAMERAWLESRIQSVDYTEGRGKFVAAGLTLPQPAAESVPVLKTTTELSVSNRQLEPTPALEIPTALTESEHEALAVQVVAAADGLPDGIFIKQFGVVMLVSLLDQKLVHMVESKLYPGEKPAAVVEPAKSAKPTLPIVQDLDPLAQAIRVKHLRRNTSTVYSLAREICNDGNAVSTWLKTNFGITPGALVMDELVKAVEGAVTTERLKYVKPSTLAELNAYGIAVHGSMTWTGSTSGGANKYSCGRTRFINRLYQGEAETWLAELKKKATPQQLLDAGRRMDSERQKAMRFASSGRAH